MKEMLNQFLKMRNTIQPYAWGSRSAIAALLGLTTPTIEPQAELWMGAHPKAPSQVFWKDAWRPLPEILETHAKEITGPRSVEKYGRNLPFLFKVLAAETPLSIQAHPDKLQAKAGYDRENKLKIPLSAAHRNYRDDNHKPECLCALTHFWALCGFRPIPEIIRLMEKMVPSDFGYLISGLKEERNSIGLKAFFTQLTTLAPLQRKALVNQVVVQARKEDASQPEIKWLLTLHMHYPEDIGVLSPFFLNLIEIAPGRAIFLKAGILHAYLHGTGVELMANSDNVLRGGLTPKHIDVQALMQVLDFEDGPIQVQTPAADGPCQKRFHCTAEEFELSVITVDRNRNHESAENRGAEILLCTQGNLLLQTLDRNSRMTLDRGESVLVPADLDRYEISGSGTIYKARGPLLG